MNDGAVNLAEVDESTWPSASPLQRAKFRDLIIEHGISCADDGVPAPRRSVPMEGFVSGDGTKVLDPIDGLFYSSLKTHLLAAYGITYGEMLLMFRLTESELPPTVQAA